MPSEGNIGELIEENGIYKTVKVDLNQVAIQDIINGFNEGKFILYGVSEPPKVKNLNLENEKEIEINEVFLNLNFFNFLIFNFNFFNFISSLNFYYFFSF